MTVYPLMLDRWEVADVEVIGVTGHRAIGFHRLEVHVEILPKKTNLNVRTIVRFGGEMLLARTAGEAPLPFAVLQPYSNGPTLAAMV